MVRKDMASDPSAVGPLPQYPAYRRVNRAICARSMTGGKAPNSRGGGEKRGGGLWCGNLTRRL
jgi:hypothetical protein